MVYAPFGDDWLRSDDDAADAAASVLRGIVPDRQAPAPALLGDSSTPALPAGTPDYMQLVADVPRKPTARPAKRPTAPYRANNPMSLMDGDHLQRFATPLEGLTAGSDHLLRYWKDHGWKSIENIVTHRSPPNQNRTEKIITDVASKLGVDKTKALDLRDPAIHIPLLKALMHWEASDTASLYKPQDYSDAFEAALRARGLEAVPGQPPAVTVAPSPAEADAPEPGVIDQPTQVGP